MCISLPVLSISFPPSIRRLVDPKYQRKDRFFRDRSFRRQPYDINVHVHVNEDGEQLRWHKRKSKDRATGRKLSSESPFASLSMTFNERRLLTPREPLDLWQNWLLSRKFLQGTKRKLRQFVSVFEGKWWKWRNRVSKEPGANRAWHESSPLLRLPSQVISLNGRYRTLTFHQRARVLNNNYSNR